MRVFILMITLSYLTACSDGEGINPNNCFIDDHSTSNSALGEYVEIEKQYSMTQGTVVSKITESTGNATLASTISTGVHVYKISYNSKVTSSDSSTTRASGLLIVPYSACADGANTASWVVLNH